MAKYHVHDEENPGGWSDWVKPRRRFYRMACCDCKLVHELEFHLEKRGNRGYILFRARRHLRATGAMRRGIERLTIVRKK
jgi:hypothetical protein